MNEIKMVVFDLDNTLWCGNVVDGKVKLKENIVSLFKLLDEHGILISIISKNDKKIAKRELIKLNLYRYIIFPQINYDQKYKNMSKICKLTGIDSKNIVFIDDDIFELDEMNYFMPHVKTLNSSKLNYNNITNLCSTKKITYETRNRRMYFKSEMKRISDLKCFKENKGEREFYEKIKMQLYFREACENDKNRILELSHRTNKFNNGFALNDKHKLIVLEYSDIYFNHGIVGFWEIKAEEKSLFIESMSISCRMYARGLIGYIFCSFVNIYSKMYSVREIFINVNKSTVSEYFLALLKKMGFYIDFDTKIYKFDVRKLVIPNYIKVQVEENCYD